MRNEVKFPTNLVLPTFIDWYIKSVWIITPQKLTFHKTIPTMIKNAKPPTLPPITMPKSIFFGSKVNSLGTMVKSAWNQ